MKVKVLTYDFNTSIVYDWWNNFNRETHKAEYGDNPNRTVADWFKRRDQILAKRYNAVYVGRTLIFKSEKDFTLFLLRWQ